MKRSRKLLVVLALIALFGGCGEPERVILLEVFSQSAVRSLDVRTISRDGLGTPVEFPTTPFSPARTPEDLLNNPIRIVIRVAGDADVIVHLTGVSEDETRLVATRCYDVTGTIQDRVVLADIGPLAGGRLDQDGDTFLVDPLVACFEPVEGETAGRTCDPTIDEFICPVGAIADCDDTPREDPMSAEQNCRPGTRDALNGFCIFPHAPVVCVNEVDEDCDGDMDEACLDEDGDTFPACPEGEMTGCDCDDSNPNINPDAEDICLDGTDQDCDGRDPCCDLDGDGVPQCIDRSGARTGDCVDVPEDCARQSPPCPEGTDPASISPGRAEICDNGVDDDCSGRQNDSLECMGPDIDHDGVPVCGLPGVTGTCEDAALDCSPGISPLLPERCTDAAAGDAPVDENANGMTDEGCAAGDLDGDGQVAPQDCDGMDRLAYTHAAGDPVIERCGDGRAQSCVPGEEDLGCDTADTDGDGYVEPPLCEGDASITPGREDMCDGVDTDCDGYIDEDLRPATGCSVVREPGLPPAITIIDFDADLLHCGGCRQDCNSGARFPGVFGIRADQCVNGTCDCMAEPGEGPCTLGDTNAICCADGCHDAANDRDNCGGCGIVCGGGETCSEGRCTCGALRATAAREQACPDTAPGAENVMCCSAACTTVTGDVNNCGGCNMRCSGSHATWECPGRACVVTGCDPDFGNCDGNPNNGCEQRLNTLEHCGGCNHRCDLAGATATCATGTCLVTGCDPGFGDCDDNSSNGCEQRLNTLEHCGGCDTPCSLDHATEMCGGGVCAILECDPGFADCDMDPTNGCEADLTDDATCGGCMNRCGTDATCGGGASPVCVCNASRLECDAVTPYCETPYSTTACGACTNVCGDMETCAAAGACQCGSTTGAVGAGTACAAGEACCGGTTCTALGTTENCGGCGDSCRAMETCEGGHCLCAGMLCGSGQTCCPSTGQCVDTDTDAANCGGCDMPCGSGEMCVGGTCKCDGRAACAGGQTCCPSMGCADVMGSDINHCLGCGMACDANTADGCSGGTCQCNGGAECSGPGEECCGSDGCRDLRSDPANCGRCGIPCGTDELCVDGACTCSGSSGTVGSGAVCLDPAAVCCSDGCHDTQNDPANCGGCGIPCASGETCNSGACTS